MTVRPKIDILLEEVTTRSCWLGVVDVAMILNPFPLTTELLTLVKMTHDSTEFSPRISCVNMYSYI